jgi:hypothetical protein
LPAASRRPPTLWLLLAAVVTACLFGWAVEGALATPLNDVQGQASTREPTGRKLYLLIIDSLAVENLAGMPTLRDMAAREFSAEVEPCVDRFTTACVREALTGRPMFSLFALLENFNVTEPGVGANLVDDAKDAGLRVAVVSSGDLRSWRKRADTDLLAKVEFGPEQLALGLAALDDHDLVLHHWVWHDVVSHHERMGTPAYQESLAATDRMVGELVDGLPEGVDLIVTGDHGHTPSGRHVEGLDVPTVVVARTPNLKPVQVEGRIPITAVRFLAGASVGIGNSAMQVQPSWLDWLADDVGAGLRQAGSEASSRLAQAPDLTGPIAAAAIMGVVTTAAVSWRAGLLAVVWALLVGATYPTLLELTYKRAGAFNIAAHLWVLPVLGGLAWGARTRRAQGAAWGAILTGLVAMMALGPGLDRNSVLKNIELGLGPALVAVAGLLLLRAHNAQSEPRARRRYLGLAAACGASAFALPWACRFSTNFFRVKTLPLREILHQEAIVAMALALVLGAIIHRLVDRDTRWMVAGALAAAAGPWLPVPLAAAAFLGLVGALLSLRGPRRGRVVSLLALLVSGHIFRGHQQLGGLLMVVMVGVGLHGVAQLAEASKAAEASKSAEAEQPARRLQAWATAALLVAGAYLGMAWTAKLSVAGIDFAFAVAWLPGRLHETFWWLIAVATVLKVMLPLVLLVEVGRTALGERLREGADLAGRLAVLRMGMVFCFSAAWMVAAGQDAASMRLRMTLQDGFAWLVVATTVLLLVRLPFRGLPWGSAPALEDTVAPNEVSA